MGTVIGLPYVASESRIDAAVLGLMGIPADARASAAKSLRIPILFLIQWNDELVAPAQTLGLFDAIGSKEKTAHINPGAHAAVPAFEIQASEDFFAKHLGLRVPAATG